MLSNQSVGGGGEKHGEMCGRGRWDECEANVRQDERKMEYEERGPWKYAGIPRGSHASGRSHPSLFIIPLFSPLSPDYSATPQIILSRSLSVLQLSVILFLSSSFILLIFSSYSHSVFLFLLLPHYLLAYSHSIISVWFLAFYYPSPPYTFLHYFVSSLLFISFPFLLFISLLLLTN
jgi:hypothetical protein